MGITKHRKSLRLASGRPPKARNNHGTVSSRKTRATIRSFHELNKRLAQARTGGRELDINRIENAIEEQGGLERYQQASIQGQALDRGGDTSIHLMQWLGELTPVALDKLRPKIRLLEVGSLSTKNACTKSGVLQIERIDLNSQENGILKQDFMQRPLPVDDTQRFDLISLSLVLNFVPDPQGRGEMLKRTCDFLRVPSADQGHVGPGKTFPALFLVLPAPCTRNSRYLTEDRLAEIMASLGYVLVKREESSKLVYSLWRWMGARHMRHVMFRKQVVDEGRTRNNFCIVLK